MGPRRTTLRSAALAALLAVILLTADPAVATPASAGSTAGASTPGTQDAPRARQARTFFWMNALRSNHDGHARASARARMRTNIAHLRRADVDFGVLAEIAPDQRRDFRRMARRTWALAAGGNTIDNVVFYRRSAFRLVDRQSLTIRYVRGQRVHVTIPVLRDRATGTTVAVIPVHNPRLKVGPWRRISLEREVRKVRQLRRKHPAWEVVVAGDFNAEWTPACAFTHAGLASPIVTKRRCHRSLPIDQMYATPALHPHGYRSVHTTATDHHREYHAKLEL